MDPRTGSSLLDDIKNLEFKRIPIVSDFLFQNDTFMISSSSGVGKSTIIIQTALSLASGSPLFGFLETVKTRTYVYQSEGDYEESIERIRFMLPSFPDFDPEYLCWDTYKYLDLSTSDYGIKFLVNRIKESFPNPELIILDPIYCLTSEDICTGKGALQIIKLSNYLRGAFNCAIMMVHHNTKDSHFYSGNQKIEKDDSYYGHSFIKNHLRTSYALKQNDTKTNPMLIRKKGRGSDTLQSINLSYDSETMICHMTAQSGSNLDRIRAYALELKASGQTTGFSAVRDQCNVSDSFLRKAKMNGSLDSIFQFEGNSAGRLPQKWIPK